MKKALSIALALVLALLLAAPVLAADDSAAAVAVSLDKSAAAVGDVLTLTLTLDQAVEGVTSFEYRVVFDTAKLTYKDAQCGTACTSAQINLLAAVDGKAPVTVNYVDPTSAGVTLAAGVVATLRFEAKEALDAAALEAALKVENKGVVLGSNFDTINSTAQVGSLTVAQVTLGDVNSDGDVNNIDAALIYAHFNGKLSGDNCFTDAQLAAADVNGDGKVNTNDAALVYAFYNGRITQWPSAQG